MILWAKLTLEINFADNLKAPFLINWYTSLIQRGIRPEEDLLDFCGVEQGGATKDL